MLKKILDFLLKIFHILFVILTFWLLFISIFRKDLMNDFMSYLENLINILWFYNYIIALFSSIVETFPILWAIVPGQNIMLLVGWFFGKISYYNLVILIFIASIWALIWNHIWYLMWKKYWDSFFEKYWIYTRHVYFKALPMCEIPETRYSLGEKPHAASEPHLHQT